MKTTFGTYPASPVSKIASEIVPDNVVEHDMDNPKYPDVVVQLVGNSNNAFSIMGSVVAALCSHGVGRDEIDQFRTEAMSGDYDQLLQTCMAWVEVQ